VNFESIEDILAYAIEKEEEAVAFYTDIAEQEAFSGVRATFQEFAEEEKKHAAMLRSFKSDKDKIAAYELKWIPDMKRSNYVVNMEYRKGMDYADILRLAMKREEKALALYNDMQRKTEDADYIRLFQVLAQEEAKHKQFLETMFDDYMAEMGD
jgi:rubrerythrin